MTRDNFQVRHVNPAELAKPSGFSHAVRVTGGTTVYLAGQTALDAEGAIVGDGRHRRGAAMGRRGAGGGSRSGHHG